MFRWAFTHASGIPHLRRDGLEFDVVVPGQGIGANRRIDMRRTVDRQRGMTALTRLPSARRASTSGQVSSHRRPTRDDLVDHVHKALSRNSTRYAPIARGGSTYTCFRTVDQNVADRRIRQQNPPAVQVRRSRPGPR